jgi:hypothetical protein
VPEASGQAARLGGRGPAYALAIRVIECHPTPVLVDMVHRVIARAHERVYITSGSLIPSGAMRSVALRRSLHAALDHKVRMFMLDDFESLAAADRQNLLNEVTRHGAEIRVSACTPAGVLIADGKAAVACGNPAVGLAECTPTRSAAAAGLLQELIDITWRTSWGLEVAAILKGGPRLDVLHQLYAGNKDEVGARLLNMSLRTYRRHVADLIKLLGASSRFEAGARAATLGLATGQGATARRCHHVA